jgi:hypothetical protein
MKGGRSAPIKKTSFSWDKNKKELNLADFQYKEKNEAFEFKEAGYSSELEII